MPTPRWNKAHCILNEETPREFFRRKGMHGRAPLLRPAYLRDLPVGSEFADLRGAVYTKVGDERSETAGGMAWLTSKHAYEVVFPLDWNAEQRKKWLMDEEAGYVTARRVTESETPREFFKRHGMGGRAQSIKYPMFVRYVKADLQFMTREGEIYVKNSGTHLAHLPGCQYTCGFPEFELVFPVGWHEHQIKKWIKRGS